MHPGTGFSAAQGFPARRIVRFAGCAAFFLHAQAHGQFCRGFDVFEICRAGQTPAGGPLFQIHVKIVLQKP